MKSHLKKTFVNLILPAAFLPSRAGAVCLPSFGVFINLWCVYQHTCETNNVTEVDCDAVKAFSVHLVMFVTAVEIVWKYDCHQVVIIIIIIIAIVMRLSP